mmetsp:Transcript_30297/g.59544  ORF Transcript_30297/g.59544 Transcript_30297/m.59544 type:complete len:86 (-) Transcript_30297:1086-1343(-)
MSQSEWSGKENKGTEEQNDKRFPSQVRLSTTLPESRHEARDGKTGKQLDVRRSVRGTNKKTLTDQSEEGRDNQRRGGSVGAFFFI